MDTQSYSSRLGPLPTPGTSTAHGGWRLAVVALAMGGVVGVAIGWSAAHATPMSVGAGAATEAAVAKQAAKAPTAPVAIAAPAEGAARRASLDVAIPRMGPIPRRRASWSPGRRSAGPTVRGSRSVHVELYVADKLVERTELDVFSSRFAGIVELSKPIGRADAELRISDASRPTGPVQVRHLTIVVPASGADPRGSGRDARRGSRTRPPADIRRGSGPCEQAKFGILECSGRRQRLWK